MIVEAGGRRQVRRVRRSRGYLSSAEPVLTFGLGDLPRDEVEGIEVQWPFDGGTSRCESVPLHRRIVVRRGGECAVEPRRDE